MLLLVVMVEVMMVVMFSCRHKAAVNERPSHLPCRYIHMYYRVTLDGFTRPPDNQDS